MVIWVTTWTSVFTYMTESSSLLVRISEAGLLGSQNIYRECLAIIATVLNSIQVSVGSF